jgi:hypothetical protein
MLRACAALFLLLAAAAPLFAAQKTVDAWDLLRHIPAPQTLIAGRLPLAYHVPVTLSGGVADDIARSLAAMGLPSPRYEEILDKNAFSLVLANADYPVETRDLVSGIINPTEMINTVLESVLKYRTPGQFETLKKETSALCMPERQDSTAAWHVRLTPLGNRFSYSYEDQGALVRETWLSRVDALLDSATCRVLEITMMRHDRSIAADAAEKPAADSAEYRYRFAYAAMDGSLLPSGLTLDINGTRTVAITAVYRRDGRRIVFDSRGICYSAPSPQPRQCLDMRYGAYRFGPEAAPAATTLKPDDYARRLAKAAELSRKAATALRKGNMRAALRALTSLADDYPETPQAIEAKKLLSALP